MALSSDIRKIVLAKSIEWNTWISFITSLTHLIEPIQPKFESPVDSAQLDMLAHELYRQQIQVYEYQLEKYETQQRAFAELVSYIKKAKQHSGHQLCVLKARLASANDWQVTYINAQPSKVEGVKIQDDTYKQTSLASEGVGKLASEHFRQFRHEDIGEFLIDQGLSELGEHLRDNQVHRHSDWGGQEIRDFDKGIKWCLHQGNVSDWGHHD
jgi:hypothetical protein